MDDLEFNTFIWITFHKYKVIAKIINQNVSINSFDFAQFLATSFLNIKKWIFNNNFYINSVATTNYNKCCKYGSVVYFIKTQIFL